MTNDYMIRRKPLKQVRVGLSTRGWRLLEINNVCSVLNAEWDCENEEIIILEVGENDRTN